MGVEMLCLGTMPAEAGPRDADSISCGHDDMHALSDMVCISTLVTHMHTHDSRQVCSLLMS